MGSRQKDVSSGASYFKLKEARPVLISEEWFATSVGGCTRIVSQRIKLKGRPGRERQFLTTVKSTVQHCSTATHVHAVTAGSIVITSRMFTHWFEWVGILTFSWLLLRMLFGTGWRYRPACSTPGATCRGGAASARVPPRVRARHYRGDALLQPATCRQSGQ